jgi:glycosyltransferase involved in cell wall biosynthesis
MSENKISSLSTKGQAGSLPVQRQGKKILMLNYEFPPVGGGGGVASKQLAKGFIANGYQVDLVTGWMKDLKRFEKVDEINVYRVQTFGRKERPTANNLYMATYLFFGFFKGVQLCWKNKYQFINTHFVLPTGPLGFILGKIFKLNNIVSIHGGDIYDPSKKSSPHRSPSLTKVNNFLLTQAKKVVAESSDTKKNAEKYYIFDNKVFTIPLAYEKFEFKKISRKELNLKDDKIYLISVGRMVKRKGYKYLVKTLERLPKNVNAIILGEGPEKENLLKLAKKLKVENRLILPGFVSEEEKFQYLDNTDIYVLSSLHEGFGIVLQEAMQVGLPIVATNNGGQVDFVKEGENGFLVEPKNSKLIAQKIKEIIKNDNLKNKISQKNKKNIDKFGIKEIAKDYLKLISK